MKTVVAQIGGLIKSNKVLVVRTIISGTNSLNTCFLPFELLMHVDPNFNLAWQMTIKNDYNESLSQNVNTYIKNGVS